MSRSRTQSPMPSSSTTTQHAPDSDYHTPSTSLRQSLRKWMGRLKRDPSAHRSPTPSLPRSATPSDHQTPIPIPAILFVPTTETIISSPKDPRNSPPNTIKKIRMERRNTAPADYFSNSSENGTASRPASRLASSNGPARDRSMSRNRNTSASRDASATRTPSASRNTSVRRPRNEVANGPTIANERARPEPMYQVTTTITAMKPPLRSRRSRMRLSFSRSASPVATTRPRAPSTNSMSSSNHTRNASLANSVSSSATSYMTPSARHSPNVRDVRAPSQIFEEGTLSQASLERMEPRNEQEEKETEKETEAEIEKEATVTVDEVRQIEAEEVTRQETDQEVKKERRLKDEEVLLRPADIRVGMMV